MWEAFVGLFINVLLFIYQVVGNFGIAIILFTILIRLLTYPLTASQLKGAQAMQDLQKDKRWIDMQNKYKNDKEKLAQEQMKLYQELKINPLGSCLPTLIQFPIIIALYQAVIRALASTPMELLNLTKAIYPNLLSVASLFPLKSHFLWMDLSQPERLLIPGLSFGIPTLAIVVMATTYIQSKMMQPPATGGANDQAAMMTNMMNIYMPFLMGYLALTLSSGLSLYFLVSNLIGIIQYAAMGKGNWANINPFHKNVAVATAGAGGHANRPAAAPVKQPKPKPETESISPVKPARIEARSGDSTNKPMGKPYRTGKPGKLAKKNDNQDPNGSSPSNPTNSSDKSKPSGKSQDPARSKKSK
jgi:YidC/Oxa1 family membrane protein insertase